jgi:hypothetical protein
MLVPLLFPVVTLGALRSPTSLNPPHFIRVRRGFAEAEERIASQANGKITLFSSCFSRTFLMRYSSPVTLPPGNPANKRRATSERPAQAQGLP